MNSKASSTTLPALRVGLSYNVTMKISPPQGRQTACCLAVLYALGLQPVTGERLASFHDVVRVLRRSGAKVRPVRHKLPPVVTVAGAAERFHSSPGPKGTFHLVRVPGHVILLDHAGRVVADTQPGRSHPLVTHAFTLSNL